MGDTFAVLTFAKREKAEMPAGCVSTAKGEPPAGSACRQEARARSAIRTNRGCMTEHGARSPGFRSSRPEQLVPPPRLAAERGQRGLDLRVREDLVGEPLRVGVSLGGGDARLHHGLGVAP